MSNIFGYPNYISGGTGGGNTYEAGAGLKSTQTGSTTYSFSASGAFITYVYNAAIEGSKALVEGNNVTFTQTATGIVINAQATGGGAPTTSSYITTTTEVTLPNSRVATSGNGVTVTDGGAGTTATFGLSSPVIQYPFVRYASSAGLFTNSKILEAGSGVTISEGSTSIVLSAAGGGGTVTSVDLTAPSIFNVTGNPITTSGTLALALANQTSGLVFASVASGSAGAPLFRRLTYLDLPVVAGTGITFTPSGESVTISGNTGTVTSVDASVPSDLLTLSGNPVTTSGTLAIGLTNAGSGEFFGGFSTGAASAPKYRRLVYQDLPLIAGSNITLTPTGSSYSIASTASGSGSVTSVGLDLPADTFSISNSPVTTSGTLTGTFSNQASSTFHAGPTGGVATTPTWRGLVGQDLPVAAGANVQLTFNAQNQLVITASVSGGGGGTVTDFTAGNLSPLFTTNVATSTTTPALSFTLSSAPSSAVFAGPVSGADASPSFRALVLNDMPTIINTFFSNTTPGVLVQTSAGVYTSRTITGTANEITVTNGDGVSANPTLSLPSGIDPAKLADGSVSATEFQYINSLSSNAQTQIDGKASNTEVFVTLGNTSGLSNERRLEVAGNLTIQDGGAGNAVTISASSLQPLDATLTALSSYNTNGFITQTAPDTFSGRTLEVAGGLTIQEVGTTITISSSAVNGTVTSVDASVPTSLLSLSGNPITTAGTLAIGLTNAASGQFWAGPTSGSAATPSYRSIVAGDLPSTTVNSSGNLSPLFTSSISNQTLSFAQVTQASSTGFFGPISGADANPTFRAMVAGDQPATTVNSVGNLSPLFTASIANQAMSFALSTAPSGTALRGPASGSDAAPTYRQDVLSDLPTDLTLPEPVRLTLTSGVPITTADVTGASSIYLTPYLGDIISLTDPQGNHIQLNFSEISIDVPSFKFRVYDVFVYSNNNTPTLELNAWDSAGQTTGTITGATAANPCVLTATNTLNTGDLIAIDGIVGTLGTTTANGLNGKVHKVASATGSSITLETGTDTSGLSYTSGGTFYKIPASRTDGISIFHGKYTKTSDTTRLYVGTFMTTSVAGQTEDSQYHRLMWNYYNRLNKRIYNADSTSSWAYTTAAWRPRNNNTNFGNSSGGRSDMIIGVQEEPIIANNVEAIFQNTSANVTVFSGVGLNTISSASVLVAPVSQVANVTNVTVTTGLINPYAGYNFLQSTEYSTATGTTTWFGTGVGGGVTILSGRF